MNHNVFSIIVPVYNSEPYLDKCIQSILNQTYPYLEIILINDGSQDKSLSIMEKYQKKDPRIIIIGQENKGANIARKVGVKKAAGQYTLFVDSDDWIEDNTLEELSMILRKKTYDIIKFNGITEPSKNIKNHYCFYGENQEELDKEKIYQLLIETKILNNLCFSVYKTDVLKNIESFDIPLSNCEDYFVNLEIYSQVEKVLMLNKTFYHYRDNINSTTKQIQKKKIMKNTKELIFVYKTLFSYLKKWNKEDKYHNKVAFIILEATRSSIFNLFKLKSITKKEFVDFLTEIGSDRVFEYIRENIDEKSLKKQLKKQPLQYRIKNSYTIQNLYRKKYKQIWLNKYLFSIRKVIR